ncbi:MAG: hypothetical protein PHV53_02530 [Fermentimonas sp.]|nr:hypothetical protein [Fermentimonas sp.]
MEWQVEKDLSPEKALIAETAETKGRAEIISEPESDVLTAAQPVEQYPESLTLGKGETLRSVALDLFGNKEFWVYIYQENMQNINNPNVIPVGTELLIPDISKYDIDADNPQSIEKAKEKGDMIIMSL